MKRVARVLNTAGTSVASGIPDFRSSGGIFDTLRPELIAASLASLKKGVSCTPTQQQSSVGVCSHKINYHI